MVTEYQMIRFIYCLGSFVYLVWGVIILNTEFALSNECIQSHLRAYVIISLLLQSFSNYLWIKERIKSLSVLCGSSFIYLILAVWGWCAIIDKSCNDFHFTQLWKFGFASFMIQIFMILNLWVLLICVSLGQSVQSNRYSDI